MDEKSQWNNSLSFIFAMVGAAVGLGNIWRFSYVLYSNGGGSFFIPYLFAIAVIGIPFLILEYGMGFSFKDSFSNVLKKINPKYEFIGWMVVLLVFFVVIYYMVILAWDMVYFLNSFTFAWGTDTSSYFINNVGGSANLLDATTFIIPTAISVIFIWAVLWYISHKDLDEGIGKVSRILIPSLFLLMAIIIIYALTLPGHMIGIDALLRPKWHTLLDINIWLAACGQIVFSLSMGQAIALTYASYLPEKSKLSDSVLYVVVSNSLFEIFTAFGVFSILGYMSLHTGTALEHIVSEGTGLVFVVFPMVFNIMGPFGRVLAPLLFLAILFAGITSALALFEPMLYSTTLKFNLSRRKATTILSIIGCSLSLFFATGIGCYLVAVVDSFINQFGVLFLIGLQCIIFAWIYNIDDLIVVINENGRIKVGKIWKFLVRYVIPIVLFAMWAIGIVDLFNKATYFEIFIDVIITVTVVALSFILTKLKPITN